MAISLTPEQMVQVRSPAFSTTGAPVGGISRSPIEVTTYTTVSPNSMDMWEQARQREEQYRAMGYWHHPEAHIRHSEPDSVLTNEVRHKVLNRAIIGNLSDLRTSHRQFLNSDPLYQTRHAESPVAYTNPYHEVKEVLDTSLVLSNNSPSRLKSNDFHHMQEIVIVPATSLLQLADDIAASDSKAFSHKRVMDFIKRVKESINEIQDSIETAVDEGSSDILHDKLNNLLTEIEEGVELLE